MKLREKWRVLSIWQKALVILRDLALYAVLLSALPHMLAEFDNSLLVLVCLPVSCLSQAALSWKQDKKISWFFLFGAVFVFVMYMISVFG